MSLRLRLTLWYSGILAATLLLVSVLVYATLAFTLNRQVSQFLDARWRQYSLALINPGPRGPDGGRGFRDLISVFNPDTYAELVLPDGSLVPTPNLPPGWFVDKGAVNQVLRSGQPAGRTIHLGDATVRVQYYAVPVNGQVVGVLALGRDTSEVEASLGFLRVVLAIAGTGGVLVAFGAGWLLARRALRPIGRIALTAQAIGDSKDFGQRVAYDGPHDELGRLVDAFNGMIGHIQVAYQQLEQALAAQRRFVADASHELRTPLTTIRGNLGLLAGRREVSIQDRQEALSDMVSEAERMSRLVSNLLVLARADSGLHVPKQLVHLDEIMSDVYRQARVLNESVALKVRGPEPVIVEGNADYLKQLLLILVDNALKNTPPGGTVEMADSTSEGWVRLSVCDSGKGIPAEALPHIFDRFYQADKARSSGGTGLGLAIAKWIVDEHEGRIDVTSELGHGSVFNVWLPRQPFSSLPPPDEVERPRPEAARTPQPAGAALG